jgi:hypothetical protein
MRGSASPGSLVHILRLLDAAPESMGAPYPRVHFAASAYPAVPCRINSFPGYGCAIMFPQHVYASSNSSIITASTIVNAISLRPLTCTAVASVKGNALSK